MQQLDIEYQNMPERHELYAKFGIAAEAAQLFETELITVLLGIEGRQKKWHISSNVEEASGFLAKIDRYTLGKLLEQLKDRSELDSAALEILADGLSARNRLTHGFFERHNFKIQTAEGRRIMALELVHLHASLFSAWQTSGKLSSDMLQALQSDRSHADVHDS